LKVNNSSKGKKRTKIYLLLAILLSMAFTNISLLMPTEAAGDFSVSVLVPKIDTDYLNNRNAYFPFYLAFTGGYSSKVSISATLGNSTFPLTGKAIIVHPSPITPPAGEEAYGYVKITVPTTGNGGTYKLMVNATGTDGTMRYGYATLMYRNATWGYPGLLDDFSVDSASLKMKEGGSASTTIRAYDRKGSGAVYVVQWAVHSLGTGLSWNATPSSVNLANYNSTGSNLRIDAGSAASSGEYYAAIVGTNPGPPIVVHTGLLSINVTDFSISATPSTISMIPGETEISTVNVTSLYGFESTINLSATGVPAGANATFSDAQVTLTPGSSTYSTLTIDTDVTVMRGTYYVTIYGTGSMTRSVILTLNIGDFEVDVAPPTLTASTGSEVDYTVTVTSFGAFSEKVYLSLTGWSNYSFAAASVTPSTGGTTTTLTIGIPSTASAGTYTLKITGTSGAQSNSQEVTLIVTTLPDFRITASPTSQTGSNGSSVTYRVSIASLNSFSSPVLLTSSIPSPLSGSFSPTTVTPPPNSVATSTLTISIPITTFHGTYTINITGTSGALSRSYSVTLNVGVSPGPSCIIATSTYGSELSPEVQFLRSFRDQTVMSTFSGKQFMTVFNTWYYSFSPPVAGTIESNTPIKSVMKVVLYPLIGTLHVAAYVNSIVASLSAELAMVTTGIVASALIGTVYLAPIALLLLYVFRRYYGLKFNTYPLKVFGGMLLVSLALLILGTFIIAPALVMFSTAVLVVSTLAFAGIGLASFAIERRS
jgi:uncharacterized membrane protein